LTDADCRASGAFASSRDCTDARIVVTGQTCDGIQAGGETSDESIVSTHPEHVVSSEEIESDAAKKIVSKAINSSMLVAGTGGQMEEAGMDTQLLAAAAGGHPMPTWRPEKGVGNNGVGNNTAKHHTSQFSSEEDPAEEELGNASDEDEVKVEEDQEVEGAESADEARKDVSRIANGTEVESINHSGLKTKEKELSNVRPRAVLNSAAGAKTDEEAIAHAIRAKLSETSNRALNGSATKSEFVALRKEAIAMRAEEAALAGELNEDGTGAFIEPAFSPSESQAIEASLSDKGVPDAQRVVDRARSTGGQFEWVGKAQAGSNAVGTFAKVQPRYTHAQASEIMALMKK
jgi:hypothetical protein